MPAAPALNEQDLAPSAPAVRPKSIDNAFTLWLVSIGLSVLGLILTLTVGGDDITKAVRDGMPGKSEQEITDAANAFKVITAVVGIIFALLYLLFAYKMRAGRNWARITLSVLGGLNVISILYGFRQSGGLGIVIGLIEVIVIAAAVFFMYRADSNQYFQASRARR